MTWEWHGSRGFVLDRPGWVVGIVQREAETGRLRASIDHPESRVQLEVYGVDAPSLVVNARRVIDERRGLVVQVVEPRA